MQRGAVMIQIKPYTPLQKQLHIEIQKIITSNKYIDMDADDVLCVFGRIYSTYCIEALYHENKIIMKEVGE